MRDRKRKRQKRAQESSQNREARILGIRESRKEKKVAENDEERDNRLRKERERKKDERLRNQNRTQSSESAATINEKDHRLLRNFRNKMDNIRYNECPICNERIPGMTLVMGTCRRCYKEKKTPKKFSNGNNMDLVPYLKS